jgi:hypothetical protein
MEMNWVPVDPPANEAVSVTGFCDADKPDVLPPVPSVRVMGRPTVFPVAVRNDAVPV